MAAFDSLLATDEDVAIKAAGDFDLLIPAHQWAAYGTDGDLSGWTLSTSANLAGLTVGHVVHLQRGAGGDWRDLLAVESVDAGAGTVTLRRIGMEAGDGPPPTVTSGLHFHAPTARPQIASVTRSILRRFGFANYAAISAALDGTGDPEHFRDLATLDVLISLLGAQHRTGNAEENFHVKYKDLLAERDAIRAELIDDYGEADTTATPLVPAVVTFPSYRRPRTGSEF